MKTFEELKEDEKSALLKFPAYITLLALNNEKHLDKSEKKEIIKFVHIKTYSCNPLLSGFYHAADKVFASNITELEQHLPEDKTEREQVIKHELTLIEKILHQLGNTYAAAMHRSMNSFKDHVSKAHRNVLEDFIFPVPIKGING
ncbi:MAG: hypothetical protein JST86_17355 [Bacteroidetes bacterium]|nr:hypothetical protein [Bacteroidota bacterium]